jgi:hypothetical protein
LGRRQPYASSRWPRSERQLALSHSTHAVAPKEKARREPGFSSDAEGMRYGCGVPFVT